MQIAEMEQGVLIADPIRGKRNMVYYKPVSPGATDGPDLLKMVKS